MPHAKRDMGRALTHAREDEEDHKRVEHRHDGQGQGREDLHYIFILYYIYNIII